MNKLEMIKKISDLEKKCSIIESRLDKLLDMMKVVDDSQEIGEPKTDIVEGKKEEILDEC